jgi:hypothetical protein
MEYDNLNFDLFLLLHPEDWDITMRKRGDGSLASFLFLLKLKLPIGDPQNPGRLPLGYSSISLIRNKIQSCSAFDCADVMPSYRFYNFRLSFIA